MIFFFVIIFLTGIANYMVPIMIGARDMAFPRVNLLGFWLVPVSILLYYGGFFSRRAPHPRSAGHSPPTEKAHPGPSPGGDLFARGIILSGLSPVIASTNVLTPLIALPPPR